MALQIRRSLRHRMPERPGLPGDLLLGKAGREARGLGALWGGTGDGTEWNALKSYVLF